VIIVSEPFTLNSIHIEIQLSWVGDLDADFPLLQILRVSS